MNVTKSLFLMAIFSSQILSHKLDSLCAFTPTNLVFKLDHDVSVPFKLPEEFKKSQGKLGMGASGLVKKVVISVDEPKMIAAVKMIDMSNLSEEAIVGKKTSVASEVAILREVNMHSIGPRFYGCLSSDSKAYLMLELFEQRIGDYKFKALEQFKSPFERLDFISDIFRAVMELWQAEFIHGDIKPDNLVLNSNRRVVLVDFGTAQKLSEKNNFGGTGLFMCKEKHSESTLYLETDLYAAILTAAQVLQDNLNLFLLKKSGAEGEGLAASCFSIAQPQFCYKGLSENSRRIFQEKAFAGLGEGFGEKLAELLSSFIADPAAKSHADFFQEYCQLTALFIQNKQLPLTENLCSLFNRFEGPKRSIAAKLSVSNDEEIYREKIKKFKELYDFYTGKKQSSETQTKIDPQSASFLEFITKVDDKVLKRIRNRLMNGKRDLPSKRNQVSTRAPRKIPEKLDILYVDNYDAIDAVSELTGHEKYRLIKPSNSLAQNDKKIALVNDPSVNTNPLTSLATKKSLQRLKSSLMKSKNSNPDLLRKESLKSNGSDDFDDFDANNRSFDNSEIGSEDDDEFNANDRYDDDEDGSGDEFEREDDPMNVSQRNPITQESQVLLNPGILISEDRKNLQAVIKYYEEIGSRMETDNHTSEIQILI